MTTLGDLPMSVEWESDPERANDYSIRDARCSYRRRKIGIELRTQRLCPPPDALEKLIEKPQWQRVCSTSKDELIAHIRGKFSIKECMNYTPKEFKQTCLYLNANNANCPPIKSIAGSRCYCGTEESEHFNYGSKSSESNGHTLDSGLHSAEASSIDSPSHRESTKQISASPFLHVPGQANVTDIRRTKSDGLLGADSQMRAESNSSLIDSTAFRSESAVEWNEVTSIKDLPCDTFGKIAFASDETQSNLAKYVRLSNSTPINDVLELMTNGWKMYQPNRPSLVISVIGGAKNFKFDGHRREVFNRGLVRAAHASSAWMITSGCNMGVMKVVGEAVSSGSEMTKSLPCIGITNWGTVQNRSGLVSSDGKGCWPAIYSVDPVIRDGQPVSLDPNHTHFILIDTGYRNIRQPKVTEFRAMLEQKIAAKDNGGLRIPVVVILIEGGLDALDSVFEYLKNGIPVVICQGTGRAADVLSYAIQNYVQDADPTITKQHQDAVRKKLNDAFRSGMRMSKHYAKRKLAERHANIEQCYRQRNLITIFDIDKNHDLDWAILNALLKGGNAKPIDQLHLALKWNRADVAAEKLFTGSYTYRNSDLYKLMTEALATNKIDFVRILLLRGVVIKDYLSVERLRSLYNTGHASNFLYQLLAEVARDGAPFSLSDIRVILEQRIGKKMDGMFALDKKEGARLSLMWKKKSIDATKNDNARFDKPFKELFLWAVLMNRSTMAQFFWERTDHPIMNALVASKIYGSMSQLASYNATSHHEIQFSQQAKHYEELAKNVIDQAYDIDSDKALLIVELPHEQWDQLNCMQMAALARDKSFMASACSQMWIDQVWRGGIKCTGLEVVIGILCPFYVLFWLHFDESVIGATRNQLSLYHRYKTFISSPIAKFCTYTISWIVFLTLYSYVVVFALRPGTISNAEIALHIWAASLVIDKIRMALTTLLSKDDENHLASLFDLLWAPFFFKVDVTFLSLHAIGFSLRWLPPEHFDITRVMFCIAASTAFFRLFRVYMAHSYLGPKLIVIRRMMTDVIMFFVILVVFMFAYSVCAQSLLFPERQFYWGIFSDIFYYPYWQLYGELSLEETIGGNLDGCSDNVAMNDKGQWCPRKFWPVTVMFGIYLLIGNILLVNLLIAIFTDVFEDVHRNSLEIWKFEMYRLSTEFAQLPILPPPLTIIDNFYSGIKWLLSRNRRGRTEDASIKRQTQRQLVTFEKECLSEYNKHLETGRLQQTAAGMQSVSEKLDKLVKDLKSSCNTS